VLQDILEDLQVVLVVNEEGFLKASKLLDVGGHLFLLFLVSQIADRIPGQDIQEDCELGQEGVLFDSGRGLVVELAELSKERNLFFWVLQDLVCEVSQLLFHPAVIKLSFRIRHALKLDLLHLHFLLIRAIFILILIPFAVFIDGLLFLFLLLGF